MALVTLAFLLLFSQALMPDVVVFSNDTPFGFRNSNQNSIENILGGAWNDLNYLGISDITADAAPITTSLRLLGLWKAYGLFGIGVLLFYKPKHFVFIKWFALAITIPLATVSGGCAIGGLIGLFDGNKHPMFFLLLPWCVAHCLAMVFIGQFVCYKHESHGVEIPR